MTDGTLDLKYYMLDWDDNVLFMPTRIFLERDGRPVPVTTREYAALRHDPSYRPLHGDWEQAFREFRDGTGDFVGDVRTALAARSHAPSFGAFRRALREARLFCIVTARGHAPATLRRGVEVFVEEVLTPEERREMTANIQRFNRLAGLHVPDAACLRGYLDLNGYVGVSSPDFLTAFREHVPDGTPTSAAPEQAKTFAVQRFVEHTVAEARRLPARRRRIAFGFSDDDRGNLQTMRRFIDERLLAEFADVRFFLYDTSGATAREERLGRG